MAVSASFVFQLTVRLAGMVAESKTITAQQTRFEPLPITKLAEVSDVPGFPTVSTKLELSKRTLIYEKTVESDTGNKSIVRGRDSIIDVRIRACQRRCRNLRWRHPDKRSSRRGIVGDCLIGRRHIDELRFE
jgi:hypothetical protein